ncbi:MAG: WD40 repeat domain-containing protein [Aggregatilineales bacterium]
MLRRFFIVGLVLSGLFAGLIALMPAFAPETAILAVNVPRPDYQQDIWLLDVQRGISYFTNIYARYDNYAVWSEDGKSITMVDLYGSNNLYINDLESGEQRIIPLKQPHSVLLISSSRIVYYSGLNNGSLIVLDPEMWEEQIVSWNNMSIFDVITEEDTIFVLASVNNNISVNIYAIDLTETTITLLSTDIDLPLGISRMILYLDEIIYFSGNQIFAISRHTPENIRTIATLPVQEIFSIRSVPSNSHQILASTGYPQTWLIDVETGESELFEENRVLVEFSPDGETLLSSRRVQSGTIIEVTRHGQHREIPVNDQLVWLKWSPDSRYLATCSPYDLSNTCYLVDTEEGTVEVMNVPLPLSLNWQPAPQ